MILLVTILLGLQLFACQQKAETPPDLEKYAKIEYTGQALHRVRLTAKRAAELGIATAPAREEKISGQVRKIVPTAAVVYDQNGNTWVFKSPDSLVFVRERVSVEYIDGERAVLVEGPEDGAQVVTVGAANLFNDAFSQVGDGPVEGRTEAGGTAAGSTGTITMQEDGTLKVVHRATGASGLTANVVIEYKPGDEDYQKLLDRVRGLQVGETKNIDLLSEK
ncbi:hypothetical protein DCC62_08335 [candidate division KSB1 bacterium]|nr:MAG: hypothetical protein DCC62_08335 [candidate division KSB1 bacterium]